MKLEHIAKTNPYTSSCEKNFPIPKYNVMQIAAELLLPGYSLVNGIYWDCMIAQEQGIHPHKIFAPKLPEYLFTEFAKFYVIGTGIALAAHFFQ